MGYRRYISPKFWLLLPLSLVLVIAVACGGGDDPTPVVVEKEVVVVKEVPVEVVKEVVVEKEVIKEVRVEVIATPSPVPAIVGPSRGGIIRVLEESEAPTLDIHRSNFGFFEYLGNIHNTIVRYDQLTPDNDGKNIVADLANEWELSPDGKTYTFSFAAGIKWHDGVPFTAEDARFSIRRMEEYGGKQTNIRTLETAEAPDDLTLVVGLSRPTPSFIKGIALGVMPIGAKHIVEREGDLAEVFIGTGPFTFKKFDRGEVFEVEKNPDYFKEGLPYLDGGLFLFIPDESTATAAFKTGRLDLAGTFGRISRSQAREIRRTIPGLQEWEKDRLSAAFLTFNTDRPPWDDVRLRRAAFLAIDRESAAKVLDQGGTLGITAFRGEFALPAEELLQLPGIRPEKDEDRAEARRLLADAGFAEGFDTSVMGISTVTQIMTMAVFFADQLSTIGINAEVIPLDVPTYVDRSIGRDFDMEMIFGTLDIPDPDGIFKIFQPGGIFNVLVDDQISEWLDAQSIESDPAKRIKIVQDIQRRVIEVVPHVMTHWITPPNIAQPYVRNFTPSVGNFTQGGMLEQLWLDTR